MFLKVEKVSQNIQGQETVEDTNDKVICFFCLLFHGNFFSHLLNLQGSLDSLTSLATR